MKTNNLGFRPGLTQTGLYSHRKRDQCSETIGADQVRGYREADLHLIYIPIAPDIFLFTINIKDKQSLGGSALVNANIKKADPKLRYTNREPI